MLVDPFPTEKLHKFVRIWVLAPKKNEAKTMEFWWKMMNLPWIPARWPISNWEVVQIKWAPKQNFLKICHFEGWNVGIWPKNDKCPKKSCLWTHFQSKNCTNLCESEFWYKMKWATKWKFLKNMLFRRSKRLNLAEKRRTSFGVLLIDPFLIERL